MSFIPTSAGNWSLSSKMTVTNAAVKAKKAAAAAPVEDIVTNLWNK